MRIAIADDDEATCEYLCRLVRDAGYRCIEFHNGRDIVAALQRDTFDLLLLDWNMPRMDGIEVLKAAKAFLTDCPPVIILTNRSDPVDVVEGLEAGADDYIVKPETSNVILARIKAVTRRHFGQLDRTRHEHFGNYEFDNLRHTVSIGGTEVTLTAKEMALAKLFFQNQHRAMSRPYILENVWNSSADLSTRTLDVHVSRIRSKLQLHPENGYRLTTVFGYGYRLESFDVSA